MRDALGFLTILPVGRDSAPGRAGLLAFPIVGAFLGGAWAATGWAVELLGGPLVAAAMVLLVDLVLTGGLHLDAVADVADAVGSRRRGAAAREVLADPAIGGVGAAALGTLLLVRFALLAGVIARTPIILIGAPAAGRAAMVWATGRMPHGPASLGSDLYRSASPGAIGATVVIAGSVASVAARSSAVGLAAVGVVAVICEAAAAWWRQRYGFPSGDAIGATGVLAESLMLAVLLGALS